MEHPTENSTVKVLTHIRHLLVQSQKGKYKSHVGIGSKLTTKTSKQRY